MWRLAGVVGVDPRPYTLRQLVWMAEGVEMSRWRRAAALMALVANAHRDPRRAPPFRVEDFDPFAERGGLRRWGDLRAALAGRGCRR